jgi:hypothetical protein
MSLNQQAKDQLQLLVDLNEPEALLATMARLARRVSDGAVTGGPMTPGEQKRWRNVADALVNAEAEVSAANQPARTQQPAPTAETSPTGAGEDRPLPA